MNKQKLIPISFVALVLFLMASIVLLRNQKKFVEAEVVESGAGAPFQKNGDPSKSNVTPAYSKQVDQLKRSVENNPANTGHLKALGQLLMDGHQHREAIRYFEKAAALRPKDDSLLFDLTFCYFSEKQYDKALRTTESILAHDPQRSQALYNKGVILAAAGKTRDADLAWQRLLTMAPESDEAAMVKNHLKNFTMK